MKRTFIAIALLATLGLASCTTVAQLAASTATSLSSSTPGQVKTLNDAVAAADLLTKSTKVVVDTGTLDRATLVEIDALSTGVHAALTDLEADNAAGHALNYASFNAALDAYNSYMTIKGLHH